MIVRLSSLPQLTIVGAIHTNSQTMAHNTHKDQAAPEILPLGLDSLLVRFSRTWSETANAKTIAFKRVVAVQSIPGVIELASSLTSLQVIFDPMQTDRATLRDVLQQLSAGLPEAAPTPERTWHIPAAFGPEYAPQLPEAAELAGLPPEEAVRDIEAQTLRVIAIGFAPGQPYLGMLPERWDMPRQSEMTESMPNGALITAVRQIVLFAADAPTGWRHIGQSAFRVFQPDTTEPFPLQAGDAIRFHHVSDTEFASIREDKTTNGGAVCKVAS